MSEPILYGPRGERLRRRSGGWPASGGGRRTAFWWPTEQDVNSLAASDSSLLRRRGRNELRRSPWASAASDAFVASAVSTGIVPRPNTDDRELRGQIRDAWEVFVDECDADGSYSFYGLQELACRGEEEGGEVFIRARFRRPEDGLLVPLQLQVLEAEMLDPTYSQALGGGRVIKNGVELDALGRRSAYHFWAQHPGDDVGTRNGQRTSVPASQVAHVYRLLRPGQLRGFPRLASILTVLKDIEDTTDAFVLRKKIQNLYATWETIPTPDATSPLDADGQWTEEQNGSAVQIIAPGPGTHTLLPPGHEIEHSAPPQDANDLADFMRWMLHALAAGAGVTYEQVSQDLRDVNFSSIRAGLIEFRRKVRQYQWNVLVFQLCRRVWSWWFDSAVIAGVIRVPLSDPIALAKLRRASWRPPGFEYVDPEKEVKAIVKAIRAGLISYQDAVADYGFDPVELLDEVQEFNEEVDERGIILDSDPRRTGETGKLQEVAGGAAPSDDGAADDGAGDVEDRQEGAA
jgi:lambda family phage portal protein